MSLGGLFLWLAARKAVDFLVAARNPGKAWRYSPRCLDNDTSVTLWAVMALRSAELSGIPFPGAAYEGTGAWFKEVTDEKGRAGYSHRGMPWWDAFGTKRRRFDVHETMTAAAMAGRILIDGKTGDPLLARGADLLAGDLPRWEERALDFYCWHFGTLALHLLEGPDGRNWKAWEGGLKEALVEHQGLGGCKDGSWEPADFWSDQGGRVYATALNALTLETARRYPLSRFRR